MDKQYKILLANLQKAVELLDDVLKNPGSDLIRDRDSAIKRFEIAFDLCWKYAKVYLEEEKGVICKSPKDCFRELYKQGVIKYDQEWLKMTDMRNDTVHTYDEELAQKIFSQLPIIIKYFRELLN